METNIFNDLLNKLSSSVIVIDQEENIFFGNRYFIELIGLPLEHFAGKKLKDFFSFEKEISFLIESETRFSVGFFHENARESTIKFQGKFSFLSQGLYMMELFSLEREKKLESVLMTMIQDKLETSGMVSLKKMVESVCKLTEMKFLLISQIQKENPNQCEGLIFLTPDGFVDNFRYSLKNTPCENVFLGESCCYPDKVAELFPEDKDLIDINAKSYIGIPLINNSGNLYGILVGIDDKPIVNKEFIFSVFDVFSSKIIVNIQEMKNQESLQIYREMVENSFDALYIYSADDLKIYETNNSACKMLGYSKEQLKKMTVLEINAEFHNNFEEILDILKDQDQIKIETEHLTSNGQKIPVEIHSQRKNINGKEYWIANVRDITQRKRIQNKLIESRKMESVGILAAGMAHDFNNLMGAIMGYVSILELMEQSSEKKEIIGKIQESVERSGLLIKRIQEYATPDTSFSEKTNLIPILKDVVYGLENKCRGRIQIHTEVSEINSPVVISSSQLSQILYSILENSIDSISQKGNVWIKASENTEKLIEIEVQDDGSGIPEKIKNKIFNPFFSTKSRTSQKGMGMGLSEVFSILSAYNGDIEIESEIGKGSTVKLKIPVYTDANFNDSEPSLILIAEDDPTISELTLLMLNKMDYQSILVEDGDLILSALSKQISKIKGMILDMRMPGIHGEELLDLLKENYPELPVIIMTANTSFKDELKNKYPQIKGIIYKPFKFKEFQEKINQIFS